jgi:hypothetical protein
MPAESCRSSIPLPVIFNTERKKKNTAPSPLSLSRRCDDGCRAMAPPRAARQRERAPAALLPHPNAGATPRRLVPSRRASTPVLRPHASRWRGERGLGRN